MEQKPSLLQQIAAWYRAQDRETRGDFIRRTGLNSRSLYDAFNGVRCSAGVAKSVATAYKCPRRWQELVIFRDKRKP